jgi:hypothetical protein
VFVPAYSNVSTDARMRRHDTRGKVWSVGEVGAERCEPSGQRGLGPVGVGEGLAGLRRGRFGFGRSPARLIESDISSQKAMCVLKTSSVNRTPLSMATFIDPAMKSPTSILAPPTDASRYWNLSATSACRFAVRRTASPNTFTGSGGFLAICLPIGNYTQLRRSSGDRRTRKVCGDMKNNVGCS